MKSKLNLLIKIINIKDLVRNKLNLLIKIYQY